MSRTLMLSALLAALPAAVNAQSHPLAGTWTVEYPGGMRRDGDEITPVIMKGKLAVAVAGDSIIATLATDSVDGLPMRPPVRLATKRADGDVTFVQTAQATVRMNDEESTPHVDHDMGLQGERRRAHRLP